MAFLIREFNLDMENISGIYSSHGRKNGPFISNPSGWEHQETPDSVPTLFNPYQGQSNPPTAMMSKGGYGLGPDVIIYSGTLWIVFVEEQHSWNVQIKNLISDWPALQKWDWNILYTSRFCAI